MKLGSKSIILGFLCGMTLALPSPLFAEKEKPAEASLQKAVYQGFSQDRHLFGPKITPQSFEDKVVMIEYWGLNCPPCLAMIPHLEETWKKYQKTGKFTLLASHCQGDDKPAIIKLMSENKVTYSVYQQVRVAGIQSRGIPFSILIDHRGNIVAQGHPNEMIPMIDGLIKAAPAVGPILGTFKPVILKSLTAKLVPGKNMEPTFAILETKAAGEDAAAQEAKKMLEKCKGWVASQKTGIESALAEKPTDALDKIIVFKKSLPSDSTYDAGLAKLKTSKGIKQLVSLGKEKITLEKRVAKLKKSSKSMADVCLKLQKRIEAVEDESIPGVAAEAKALGAECADLAEQCESIGK